LELNHDHVQSPETQRIALVSRYREGAMMVSQRERKDGCAVCYFRLVCIVVRGGRFQLREGGNIRTYTRFYF